MYIVIGLGNIGKKFEGTRHNIGFSVLDEFAKELGLSFKKEASLHCDICVRDNIILAKPTTLVNCSGLCAKALLRKFMSNNILVVCDDIESKPGAVNIKFGSGHRGHNGVKDIINSLHTKDFSRLLIGTGRPNTVEELSDFVLSRFSISEMDKINEGKNLAIESLYKWIDRSSATND